MTDTTIATIRFDPTAEIDASTPTTTHEWYADPTGRFKSGFWASAPGRWDVTYDEDEFCVLLAGTVRLTDASGKVETYRTGDTFLIPSGFVGVWETVEPVRKFYAIHRPAED